MAVMLCCVQHQQIFDQVTLCSILEEHKKYFYIAEKSPSQICRIMQGQMFQLQPIKIVFSIINVNMILKYSFTNVSDHTLQNISSILCVSNNKLLLITLINIYHLPILCLLLLQAFVPLLKCLLLLRTRTYMKKKTQDMKKCCFNC